MITPKIYFHNGQYMSAETYSGLSTDSKPTSCGNGSDFIEIDNVGKVGVNPVYVFDAENGYWYPRAETEGGGT